MTLAAPPQCHITLTTAGRHRRGPWWRMRYRHTHTQASVKVNPNRVLLIQDVGLKSFSLFPNSSEIITIIQCKETKKQTKDINSEVVMQYIVTKKGDDL